MKPETEHQIVVVLSSSIGVTVLTLIVALGFFEEGLLNTMRDVIISNTIFLLAYWGWLKTYGHYKKMYRLGLNE